MTADEAIPELVRQFEAATVAISDFHHREHLIVALWYSLHYSPDEALDRMRAGLEALLAANQKPEAYREDVTRQWMTHVENFLATADRSQPFVQLSDLLLAFRSDSSPAPVR